MHPLAVVLLLLGLVALATVLGLVWRVRQGRPASVAETDALHPSLFGDASALGARATLVQFSTQHCSTCPATHRLLSEVSRRTTGVVHLDVDVTERADLIRRFSILQTPTTLILDRHGVVRTRIGGSVRRDVVESRLEELV
ncbi:thioredoxin family protein [Herbiconiux sp.]|uniref:TlpA family protein disulfide reductase n=1 Tax=Herbiconiux sp. TaxID=1871186 RepID=UPI0025C23370|nr:thioredoxin family protein [Herbiconiux sp.]